MNLAIATKEDFRRMLSIYRQIQNLEWADNKTRSQRCKMVIICRLNQIGGGFMRIVMGCEMLIKEVCDPTKGHYALKPVYGAAPKMLESLQEIAARLEDHPSYIPDITSEQLVEGDYGGDEANITDLAHIARAAIASATGELV